MFFKACSFKNKTTVKLFCCLCLTGRSEWIELKFMVKGHMKFGPDEQFVMIKKVFHRSDAFSMNRLKEIIGNSSERNRAKRFPSYRFKDFRTSLDIFFTME